MSYKIKELNAKEAKRLIRPFIWLKKIASFLLKKKIHIVLRQMAECVVKISYYCEISEDEQDRIKIPFSEYSKLNTNYSTRLTALPSGSRKILFVVPDTVRKEPCPICKGSKSKPCVDCSGKGRVICKECHGFGQVMEDTICSVCFGDGKVSLNSKIELGNDDIGRTLNMENEHLCYKCKGTGYVKETTDCYVCDGLGTITCYTCRGSRSLTCNRCEGEGYLFNLKVDNTTYKYTDWKPLVSAPSEIPNECFRRYISSIKNHGIPRNEPVFNKMNEHKIQITHTINICVKFVQYKYGNKEYFVFAFGDEKPEQLNISE